METQNPLPFTHMLSLMVKLYLFIIVGLQSFAAGIGTAAR